MLPAKMNRRQFLQFGRNKKTDVIRPPWALAEETFQHACTRCGDCIDACPEKILIREGVNGYPQVDFKRGECTFCGDCVERCPTAALDRSLATAWQVKAVIGDVCLAFRHVICCTCAEQCEAGAISFKPQRGGVGQPDINLQSCIGCGACVAPCPTQAIEVVHVQ